MANFNIAEIFGPSIQGEGPNVGCKCIFVRVVGCDFKCEWCFGIAPNNYRVPRVIKSTDCITDTNLFNNTAGTMLQDVKIGDVILTYDDNMKLVETEVKNVLKRKAECLKIKIEGRTYLVTPEHSFFTKRGLVQAKDLLIGDQVIGVNELSLNNTGSFTVQDISNYDKAVDVVNLSCEPYNTYLADGMWVHNCDSKFAWKETNDSIRLDTRELTDRLLNMCKQTNTSRVILTGGNPCLYDFSEVINILHDNDIFVDVETQGSKLPEWLTKVDQLVISPKAPSSKQVDVFDNVRQFVNREDLPLNYNVAIKIPIFNDDDFMFAQKYYNLVNSLILEGTINAKMYLSVGNTDTNEVGDISKRVLSDYNKLIEKVCNSDMANVYVLPQVHTLIWGNKQGV